MAPDHAAARSALRVTGLGHAMYAAAVAGLGVLLISSELVYVWAPVPRWVPLRDALTCAAGAVMLASAIGLVWRKTVALSSAILTFVFLCWLLLLQVPRIIATPSAELLWSGSGQITTVVAGGWVLFASSSSPGSPGSPTEGPGRWVRGDRGVRMARTLFALALPVFGLHHFFNATGAAQAIPAWLPLRLEWAYLTGAAHIVAGLAILLGIVPRLAATLEAIMVTAFVLLIHVPGIVDAAKDPLQWTMFFVAAAIGGAAWILARSFVVVGSRKP